jgi:hypothetical protein
VWVGLARGTLTESVVTRINEGTEARGQGMLATMFRALSILGVFTLSTVALPGCEKKLGDTSSPDAAAEAEGDPVDHLTQKLLVALATGDRDRIDPLSTSTLAGELDERTVAVLGRTLSWLGAVESLEGAGDEAIIGGVTRRYQVGFSRGSIGLAVTIIDGKVEGFAFDEDRWAAYDESAVAAVAGSLRVVDFAFVNPHGGGALTGPLDPADVVYRVSVEGVDAQLREHHVSVAKLVFDEAGNQVYRQPKDDEFRFRQYETGSSGGRVEGNVAVPGPGRYELELTITDLIGGATLVHRVPFTIEPRS